MRKATAWTALGSVVCSEASQAAVFISFHGSSSSSSLVLRREAGGSVMRKAGSGGKKGGEEKQTARTGGGGGWQYRCRVTDDFQERRSWGG